MSSATSKGSTRLPKRPEILVSAQSIEEFEILATINEVDIIDLKDPSWGAISPVPAKQWQQVAARSLQMNVNQSLSAALGEFDQANHCAGQLPSEFQFAKMGSSGCENTEVLQQRWQSIRKQLPESSDLVAVAYADFTSAKSIGPMDVLRSAANSGLTRILIDTFNKDGQTSIDHLGIEHLQEFACAAHTSGIWWSLAGSINLMQVEQLASAGIQPDCIGVRGAVCEGGRAGALSEDKCRRFGLTVSSC